MALQRVLIVEDELPAQELLLSYCARVPELELKKTVRFGREAMEELRTGGYDLVFLDVHLPDMSGFEVLDAIDRTPNLIFTTAYDEYAVRAFEMEAVDYLLKPFTFERFEKAVKRCLQMRRSALPEQLRGIGITVREDQNYFFILFKDIIYLSSHGKHTILHTIFKDFEASRLLHELESRLPAPHFVRIHKQFIVNAKYISHLQHITKGDYVLFLKDEDETQIPVSRLFAGKLKSVIGFS